jgi:hypothetical protein
MFIIPKGRLRRCTYKPRLRRTMIHCQTNQTPGFAGAPAARSRTPPGSFALISGSVTETQLKEKVQKGQLRQPPLAYFVLGLLAYFHDLHIHVISCSDSPMFTRSSSLQRPSPFFKRRRRLAHRTATPRLDIFPQMAQVPTQSYPPRAFFDDNIAFNASKLVGSFEHGCDYEIALNTGYNGATRGNFFVYKKRSDNGVFRAFLLGTVARVEPVGGLPLQIQWLAD